MSCGGVATTVSVIVGPPVRAPNRLGIRGAKPKAGATKPWLLPPEARELVARFEARTKRRGAPITDGVFPEAKEFLLGYWIVDVESPQRAYEIAARLSAGPGPGGATLSMPIEVRQIMSVRTDEPLERDLL